MKPELYKAVCQLMGAASVASGLLIDEGHIKAADELNSILLWIEEMMPAQGTGVKEE